MKNINKVWVNSLSFLDNSIVKSVIIIILVLYSSSIFDNINSFVGNIYNFSIVRLLILLLIVYVSPKCPTIGILLGISYVISLSYMVNNENFALPFPQKGYCPDGTREPCFQETDDDKNYMSNSFVKESFFPLVNEDDTSKSFDMRLKNTNVNTRSNSSDEHRPSGNINVPESCMQNYAPRFESVSDVCTPTATFKNELNAQGLNFPEGFDHTVNGSPL